MATFKKFEDIKAWQKSATTHEQDLRRHRFRNDLHKILDFEIPRLSIHAALVSMSGRNASRGTVVSMCMLSSVLMTAPATAGPN